MDNKIKELSKLLVNQSLKVKENDKVLIVSQSLKAKPLIIELIKEIFNNKGIPFVRIIDVSIDSLLKENSTAERIKEVANHSKFDVENYDCFINIRYINNDYESKNIDSEIRQKIAKANEKYDDIRINKRRWVLLNYPSHLDAYKTKMTNEEFFNYAMEVMTIDYEEMYERVRPLKELMEKTDKVRITGKNTDLTFSIKNMKAIPCCGTSNIPDGEIYTAPIKTSVNGTIKFNTPSPYQGNVFNDVSLTFENGKIIKCDSKEGNEPLEKIFDTDEGARYVGEFAIGLNPKILNPMGDILYDEKIIGSIHFTPGRCYSDADNGNLSSIHWDLVLIQREEYGGGELYFDDKLIRKNGLFVIPELKHLNYNLK